MATISEFTEIQNLNQRRYKMLVEDSAGNYYSIDPEKAMGGIVQVYLTLTQAMIQALNTTPQVLLEAQGANTLIRPIDISIFYQHNGTDYATATYLRAHNTGQTNYIKKTSASFVQDTASRRESMLDDNSAAGNYLLFPNSDFVIGADADATNNGGSMFVSALLRVVRFA